MVKKENILVAHEYYDKKIKAICLVKKKWATKPSKNTWVVTGASVCSRTVLVEWNRIYAVKNLLKSSTNSSMEENEAKVCLTETIMVYEQFWFMNNSLMNQESLMAKRMILEHFSGDI